ncbi:hypothetical protein [Thalassotalea sp. G2M2-11]|uniref:hypothetical protein n=1 Tax=Thalassotalea sp. G2M2-11 TaxID=2787627 RepID=UPI0019D0E9EA|nr:hypothetical protein [Thalassotalea sp. G2M2-11]
MSTVLGEDQYDASIILHEPWTDFLTFMSDVGPYPDQNWIFTRIDKNKGFTPANCKWVTHSQASILANKRNQTISSAPQQGNEPASK